MAYRIRFFSFLMLMASAASLFAQRGDGELSTAQPANITPEQIIQKFTTREKEFSTARDTYTFRQDVLLQTLDGSTPTGEYRLVVDVTFDDKGKRRENVIFSPQPTLTEITLDPEDFQDINHQAPFVLTSDELPDYQVLYVGQQRLDEIDTYVFDVAPKEPLTKGRRYFQGRVWVDNQDYEIVKSNGKAAFMMEKRLIGHQFSTFTTYREQIDGKYWFPTYSSSDEVLHFPGDKRNPPQDIHIRIKIKYEDYKKFSSRSKIIFAGEEIKKDPEAPKK